MTTEYFVNLRPEEYLRHMIILDKKITNEELKAIAANIYEDMVKAVVDIDTDTIALDAELHSDLETLMLRNGSLQESLWGINLYPDADDEDFIEYDSIINIRPRQNNRSRDVENEEIRQRIRETVNKYIER
ncbi:MAG: DUF5674 family protein [Bacteroidales bacterium]|nr:DUF5674 family protein [Bacteroidales bacterium]